MYFGFKGLCNVIKYVYFKVFIFVFFGYIVVGFGSMVFYIMLKCKFFLSDSVCICFVLMWNVDEM